MRMLAFLALLLATTAVSALPTVEDVEHAVHRGDYAAAESMTREVIAAKPDNAKAHYILAEILFNEGHRAEAVREANAAAEIDPQIKFTTPERFREFQATLRGNSPARHTSSATPASSSGGSSFGSAGVWLLVIVVIGGLFLFARRRANPMQGGYGGYVPPNGPVPPGGVPGAPGYYPPGYPGSGVGSGLAAGLGGLAAGMVAEHLIEEALDHRHGGGVPADPSVFDNPPQDEQRPVDFGTGSDWDSGSSGDGGGSDSSFDSGGGDWS